MASTIFSTAKFSRTKREPRWPSFFCNSGSATSCSIFSVKVFKSPAGAKIQSGRRGRLRVRRHSRRRRPFAGGEAPAAARAAGLRARQMDERVHDPDIFRNLGRRNKASEDKVPSQANFFRLLLKFLTPFAVADEEESDFWISAHEFGRDGEQVIMALELEQPGDFADTKSSGARPSFLRSSRSFFAARNGSSGKPLKFLCIVPAGRCRRRGIAPSSHRRPR